MTIKTKLSGFLQERRAYEERLPKVQEMAWEKKGNLISLVCHESFFVEAPNNTWWVDSSSTIHIVNSMQGFLNLRKPKGNKQCIYSRNRMCSKVEGIGTFLLILKTGYVLDLNNVFYVPSFSRNLISISKLVVVGYGFLFENLILSIFKNKVHIGGGTLVDSCWGPFVESPVKRKAQWWGPQEIDCMNS